MAGSLLFVDWRLIAVQLLAISLALGVGAKANGDMGLSLSLSGNSPRFALDINEHPSQLDDSAAIINRVVNDDFSHEFKLTEEAIKLMDETLEKFALGEGMDLNKKTEGNFVWVISNWLLSKSNGQPLARNPLIEKTTLDLDYVYANYWISFRRLISSIITERTPELAAMGMAFRCERQAELGQLKQLASTSSIYRVVLDIFSSELYTHCVTRKFATIKLMNVAPSSILRQFVDIYLDLPTQNSIAIRSGEASMSEAEMKAMSEVHAQLALGFNLVRSLEIHGPLERAAELVFAPSSGLSFGFGGNRADTKSLIGQFVNDCRQHSSKLAEVWGKFDLFANFLSSPMNDLVSFNEKIKTVAPQLLYGTICGQLAQTVTL